ncbi:MAG TPA: hypothetical protein VFE08_16520, partial [Candidatus Sulfotelmatobacter sp.]|nr:hypothetical protein [Candidatus Sulfotelmatobacter sp.]
GPIELAACQSVNARSQRVKICKTFALRLTCVPPQLMLAMDGTTIASAFRSLPEPSKGRHRHSTIDTAFLSSGVATESTVDTSNERQLSADPVKSCTD